MSQHPSKLSTAVQYARYYKKTPTVYRITVEDEFERLWEWTPTQGEKEMSRFAQRLQETTGNWVNSSTKKLLADHRIPFTVTQVSDMTWNKNFRVDEWNLSILFTPAQCAEYPELKEEMTLTVSSSPKATREDLIKDMKADIEDGERIENVILTYDPNVGRNGWYDFSQIRTPEVATA